MWDCVCDCGEKCTVKGILLTLGKTRSCRCLMRETTKKRKMGANNPMWAGDNVSNTALHAWVKRNKPYKELCEKCLTNKPYDVANISGDYLRDINDFEWLCRRCHMESDGRLKKFLKNRRPFKSTQREMKCHAKVDKR